MKKIKLLKRLMVMALAACVLWSGSFSADAATLKDVFDERYYADNNPDLKAAFGYNREALWLHYTTYGMREGRNMSSLLDVQRYRSQYPDLEAAFGDNWDAYVDHYLTFGAREGRNTFTEFNALDYGERYGDLKAAFGSDVLALWRHYQIFGAAEGRDGRAQAVVDAETAADKEQEKDDAAGKPAGKEEDKEPGKEDAGENPGGGENGKEPGKDDASESPSGGESDKEPGKDDIGENPGGGESDKEPGKDDASEKPGEGESGKEPGKDDAGENPGGGESGKEPGKDDTEEKPAEGEGYTDIKCEYDSFGELDSEVRITYDAFGNEIVRKEINYSRGEEVLDYHAYYNGILRAQYIGSLGPELYSLYSEDELQEKRFNCNMLNTTIKDGVLTLDVSTSDYYEEIIYNEDYVANDFKLPEGFDRGWAYKYRMVMRYNEGTNKTKYTIITYTIEDDGTTVTSDVQRKEEEGNKIPEIVSHITLL